MLQGKTFNMKKNVSINEILSKNTHQLENLNETEQMTQLSKQINEIKELLKENPKVIKNGRLENIDHLEFQIIKEHFTQSYFLLFPKIIILHIHEKKYSEFIKKFINDNNYSWYVFKSQRFFHAICVSHLKSEINGSWLKFYYHNFCDHSSLLLSSLFSSFLILNENTKDFNNRRNGDINSIYKNKLQFIRKIGLGPEKYPFIKSLIHFYNNYIKYTTLPINYLNIYN